MLETAFLQYELQLDFSLGRIESYPGEILYSKEKQVRLISRNPGSDGANFYHHEAKPSVQTAMTFPEKNLP